MLITSGVTTYVGDSGVATEAHKEGIIQKEFNRRYKTIGNGNKSKILKSSFLFLFKNVASKIKALKTKKNETKNSIAPWGVIEASVHNKAIIKLHFNTL